MEEDTLVVGLRVDVVVHCGGRCYLLFSSLVTGFKFVAGCRMVYAGCNASCLFLSWLLVDIACCGSVLLADVAMVV